MIGGDAQSPEWELIRGKLQRMYRWGKWEHGETIFAGMHVRQDENCAIEIDMRNYVLENVDQIVLSAERKKQLESDATPQEISSFRAVCGTAQWCVTQLFVQYAVVCSILLSSVAELKVAHLVEANKMMRDIRACADQKLRFFTFGHCPWYDLGFAQYGDASPNNRPRGYSTGGQLTLLVDETFRAGMESPSNVVGWRSFKLPRKVLGSNGGEAQVFSFAEETLWLCRLAWAEVHGLPLVRFRLHDAVRQVSGCIISDSRGIYDAARKSESPQKGLRSSKAGVELEQACEDALRSNAAVRWNHGGAMLSDCLTKNTTVARRVFELYLGNQQRWRLVYDPKFQSERRRTRAGMSRLMNEATEEEETGVSLNYVDDRGKVYLVKLAIEDGWAKLPDTEAIKAFISNCRKRIRQDDQIAEEVDSDDSVLGQGFTKEARQMIEEKHATGAFNIYPVPLAQDFEGVERQPVEVRVNE